jgi:hypothetical protein
VISPTLKALALEQCLPLLITKASAAEVLMGRMSVPAATLSSEHQLHEFHREFIHRRLLAEAPELVRILQEIGQKPSWHNRLERKREQTLRGRLDVAQYIRERARPQERPRTFPLVTQERQFDTPENRLAAGALGSIRLILASEVFPARTAESTMARSYFRSLTQVSREAVFLSLKRTSLARKDLALTRFRVNRRMTGNDRPYRQLLLWIDNWLSIAGLASETKADRAVSLSLPESESYWEKVFEVWCLEQTRAGLVRLGWTTDSDFRLHASRTGTPIATFRKANRVVDVYFQMQKPIGAGRWRSAQTNTPLVGIPDVVLARKDKAPLIVDAKWRFRALGQGTSEEQYKMLGYAENFAHNQPSQAFFGLLIFPSNAVDTQTFSRGKDSRLTTLRTDLLSDDFRPKFEEELSTWLRD